MKNWQMLARRVGLALTLTLGMMAAGCYGTMEPLGGSGGADDDDTTETPDAGTPVPTIDAGGGPSAAETAFNTDVLPVLKSKCGACHQGASPIGPAFLGSSGDTGYYAALKSGTMLSLTNVVASRLLAHKHIGAGTEFDDAEKDKVKAWITLEATP